KIKAQFYLGNGRSLYADATEGKVLQEYPFPSPDFSDKYFGGWYKDIECKNQVSYYNHKIYTGTVFYAKFTDEPTDGLFDYSVDDYGKIVIRGYLGTGGVTVPESMVVGGRRLKVSSIGERAFSGGEGKVVLSEGITAVREYAFDGDYSALFLPSTLKSVKANAVNLKKGKVYFDGEINSDVFSPKWNLSESPVLKYSDYEEDTPGSAESQSFGQTQNGSCNSSLTVHNLLIFAIFALAILGLKARGKNKN
ncbi:MAG: hypothetical protein IJ800_05055, partial [Clostridia bacterium]|nr:hypothetical protein [Clostridia bacterium]